MLALGESCDLVERCLSTHIHVLPTLGGKFADRTEVLLVVVVELLCEPYVRAEDHKDIGRARYVIGVTTTTVRRAAGSSVAKQDVNGGTVLNNFVESGIELGSCAITTVWAFRYSASGTSARSCNGRSCRSTHAGPVMDG